MPLRNDLLLALSNKTADAPRALFAALGYTPRNRIFYSADTLGWPQNVAADLRDRSFELLTAVDDANTFQVLLLPPHTATTGLPLELQRRLFRTLNERLTEGLLVLPNMDWDLFELVLLVDTRTADEHAANAPLQFPRFSFDPRALRPQQQRALELLDVVGVAGAEVGQHLRRAFGRAQQETLFRSQGFFSNYYLERRIDDADAPIRAVWATLPGIAAVQGATGDIDTLLATLGWAALPGAGGVERLRPTAGSDDAALLARLPAGAPLEQGAAGGAHPQLALIAALEGQKQQSNGIAWGILTNGRTWRLYSTLTSSISGVYYEIDLHDLTQFGDERDHRYFTGFFGAAGLATPFARQVFYASQTLAKQVGDNLKRTIFQEVFEELANGLADDLWRRGQYTGDEAQRQLLFRATLIVLYRILFLLYAESRRLLPTMHPDYYGHSLTRLLTDIAIQPFTPAHNKRPLGATAMWAWTWLRDLCAAVDAGRADWGVPRYNGGLFSDGRTPTSDQRLPTTDNVADLSIKHQASALNPHKAPHRLLHEAQIGALYLHRALDRLGRDPEARNATMPDQARRLIDYAALDVRRLGSIYEGLLEYQLVPGEAAEDGAPTLSLAPTSQGRKASGSYYTPEYIVRYIVEQTVGPVLQEREQQFEELMPRLSARRREYDRYERNGYAGAGVLRDEVQKLEHEASELLLDIKVLDPAMGSGHFLVTTVDFLADRLLAILQRHPQNPIRTRLNAIRADIRASLREQRISDALIGEEALSDPRLLRRLVMKRCVYGVDLNDMAVELARLSLWLHSFTVGAPLSFLDHHLKWGNSLIGARAQQVQSEIEVVKTGATSAGTVYNYDLFGQDSAFAEMLNLAQTIEELVQIADANGTQVERSEELYATYEQHVVPVKRLLDLWVSQHFGSKEAVQLLKLYTGSRKDVSDLVDALMGRRTLDAAGQRAVERARELFTRHRFLHWDLDFPEVFIDLHSKTWKSPEQGGFDAVVGNPPWGASVDETTKKYLVNTFSTKKGEVETHLFMSEQAARLLRREAFLGFVTPNTWLTQKRGKSLRQLLLAEYNVVSILHLRKEIFEEVPDIVSVVFIVQATDQSDTVSSLLAYPDVQPPYDIIFRQFWKVFNVSTTIWKEHPQFNFNVFRSTAIHLVCTKIEQNTLFLNKQYHAIYGVRTGENDKHVKPHHQKGFVKCLVNAGEISRYSIQWDEEYLDPSHLLSSAKLLELAEPKILVQYSRKLSMPIRIMAACDLDGEFTPLNRFSYIVARQHEPSLLYLMAVEASSTLNFYHANTFIDYDIKPTYIQDHPIRRIAFTTPPTERAALLDEAKALYGRGQGSGIRGQEPGDWRAWREHWRALWAWADARLQGSGVRDQGSEISDQGATTQKQSAANTNETSLTPDPRFLIPGEQSDVVHDLLAFLAERMIALNKQKQADARTFTAWLESETGTQIAAWKNKTTVQRFWERSWEDVVRAVQANRGAFTGMQGLRGKAADAALEPLLRDVRAQWAQARSALAPTLAALAATDRLIDLLVYRLYGLPDEEIDLVEGG